MLTLALHQATARVDVGVDLMAELNRADQARVDRLAISRTLVDLKYLEMRRVVRPPKNAKRRSRAELRERARASRRRCHPADAIDARDRSR